MAGQTEQADPPKLNHLAPKWFHDRWEEMRQWMRHHRIVQGDNVRITDAPGGGKKIDVDPSSGVAPLDIWPFQGYLSPFAGTGTPPSNQNMRIRIRPGLVNTLLPSNIDDEFLMSSGATFIWVKAQFSGGGLTSAMLEKGASVPAELNPGEGQAPAASYKGLVRVIANSSGITDIQPLVKSSLDVRAVVVAYGCQTQTRAYQWST